MARNTVELTVLSLACAAWGTTGVASAQQAPAEQPAAGVAITITVAETQAPPPSADPPVPEPSAASALGDPTVFVGVPAAPLSYPVYATAPAASPSARFAPPAGTAYDATEARRAGLGTQEQLMDEPPGDGHRVGRMFAEAGLGLVGMAVGGVGGALLGFAPCAGGSSSGGGDVVSFGCIGTVVGGAVLGMGFGTPAGIALAGSALDGNGGYGWTLLGTSAGFLVALSMASSVGDSDGAYALTLLPLLGGVAAYELSSDASASFASRHASNNVQASVAPTRGGVAASVSGVF